MTPTACGLVIPPAGSPVATRVMVIVLRLTKAWILEVDEATEKFPLPPATETEPEAPHVFRVIEAGATVIGFAGGLVPSCVLIVTS